jgi:hypothetical protein
MRLTELTHIGQIKDLYITLRSAGCDREEATQKVLETFPGVNSDQTLTFWVGLADGQYARKELTLCVAQQGLLALHRLGGCIADITPGDIERRRKHYSQAPMPERKLGRPPKKV